MQRTHGHACTHRGSTDRKGEPAPGLAINAAPAHVEQRAQLETRANLPWPFYPGPVGRLPRGSGIFLATGRCGKVDRVSRCRRANAYMRCEAEKKRKRSRKEESERVSQTPGPCLGWMNSNLILMSLFLLKCSALLQEAVKPRSSPDGSLDREGPARVGLPGHRPAWTTPFWWHRLCALYGMISGPWLLVGDISAPKKKGEGYWSRGMFHHGIYLSLV